MKALQLTKPGQLDLIEAPPPSLPAGHLLVRTAVAVICTSDLADIRENPFGIRLPQIIGHEGAGVVEAAGDGVKDFAPGDRIAAHPVHPCRQCPECRSGVGHLCRNMWHLGINMSGTFAEFFVVRADRARKVGDMPLGLAALAEPVCVCLEALAQARLAAGGRLLIIGDGPFGAMLANLAPEFKPAEVVIAGHHDFRMGFAPPATTKVNLKTAGADALKKLAGPLGFDAAILAVGSAKAVATCIELLRPKGRLVIFSAIPGLSSVDLFRVHVRELELIGACNDQERFDEALSHLRQPAGRDLGRLITHGLPLEQYRQAIELADRGRETAMKVAFELKAGELPR